MHGAHEKLKGKGKKGGILMKVILHCAFYLFPFSLCYAAAAHTQEAVQWLYKAVDAYDRQDYGAAKTSLAAALEEQPNFAEAYLLKALLQYHDGELEQANASLERALQLNPRLPDKMRQRLEQQAHAIESGLTHQDFSHFRLEFNGAAERDKAWEAVKSLDDAYNDLGSRFSLFPPARITVIIFTSEEFWEAWNAPLWLGGFFDKRDGRIRVRIDSTPGGQPEYNRRLRHEFTHAFIHQLYPQELPLWFQEGIAQFYAYADSTDSYWKENRLEDLEKAMKGAPWLTLNRLETIISKKNVAPGYIYLAYLESEALVLSIAKERGESWIPSVVERLRQRASFDAAFQQVVGLSAGEMLERLHQSLQ
jgi:tetratricopeptide (TPR) repeat protein